MSRLAVQAALEAAIREDAAYKAVKGADVELWLKELPAAAVQYAGDESTDLRTADGQVYRWLLRLYVPIDPSLGLDGAFTVLLARVDALDTLLQAHRRLTGRAEVIGSFDGVVESIPADDGIDRLAYTTTLRIVVRPVRDVVLTAGASTVTVHDVPAEPEPVVERPVEYLRDASTGRLVAYTEDEAPEIRTVSGRVDSAVEVASLVAWYDAGTPIAYTDLRGLLSAGWRISGRPAPKAERRDTASEQYDVTLTLWRIL